ncbi:AcvB/VirJ family lysyl-phosphatidylglycerol hydrolase [Pedobacter sp. PWIIR3]
MKWILGLILIFTFSGCGILMRNRYTSHHGVEKNEYALPVISYAPENGLSRRILFLFSGDGGWTDFEDQLAISFATKGFHVVGFNSRSYFWEQRTPEQTTNDIQLLMNKYVTADRYNRIYLCGYSFGADVLPFIYNRLPVSLKSRVQALEMLSPFASSDFIVHTSDLLNLSGDDYAYKVQPEVELVHIPVYCFYGAQEDPKPLAGIKLNNFVLKVIAGSHKYDKGEYAKIVSALKPAKRLNKQQ